MKKMPTLFIRKFENNRIIGVSDEVVEGCEWVLKGEGVPTQKLDGTCCLVKDGVLYARYDYKVGRKLPDGAIPCQDKPDETTGHFPHWVRVTNQPQYKWYRLAFEKQSSVNPLEDGTYELIGVHFQNNPEKVEDGDILVKHGSIILDEVPRTFEGIRDYLASHNIEGIVFHRGNGDMCKIKRSDFGFEWNNNSKGH